MMKELGTKPKDITCTKEEIELAADLVRSSATTGEELNEPTILVGAALQNVSVRVENVFSAIQIIENLSGTLSIEKKDENFEKNLLEALKNSKISEYIELADKVEEISQPPFLQKSVLSKRLVDCDLCSITLVFCEKAGFITVQDILLESKDLLIEKLYKEIVHSLIELCKSFNIDYPLTETQKEEIRALRK